ncbi:hypothetical protein M5K25_012616 [Dendrobium thyrsiflorum]|uniref:DUF4283 domain-containing protein n=1 Tax=Dendrobium thyrsiflorum TaxID=117978 RepID=A0ABD0UXY9_DENTH
MASLSSMDFPSLPSLRTSEGGISPPPSRNWKNIVVESDPSSKDIPLSYLPKEPEIIPFAGDRISKGAEHWKLCLVGYSVGRRPFYEALLKAIRNTWTLKGSFQLLSLSEGFFLLRFTSMEDYEMAWSKGVWFFLGKPFLLQKWSPKFRPKRENLTSVPIWVKIHDLPLVCWNSEGISRIASKIGIPLAVDALTAQKTRLTFARVCVQVSAEATYPEEIAISLEDEVFSLKVQYEWKPTPCEHCNSLTHYSSYCPSNPAMVQNINSDPKPSLQHSNFRGRSKSRRPTNRKSSDSPHIRISRNFPDKHSIDTTPMQAPVSRDPAMLNLASSNDPTTSVNTVATEQLIPKIATTVKAQLPNLNSPTEEASSSTSTSLPACSPPHITNNISPNKFGVLQTVEEEQEHTACSSSKDSEPEDSSQAGDAYKLPHTRSQITKSAKGKQSRKPPHHK